MKRAAIALFIVFIGSGINFMVRAMDHEFGQAHDAHEPHPPKIKRRLVADTHDPE